MKSFIFFVLATLILNIYAKPDRLTVDQARKLAVILKVCKQDLKITIEDFYDLKKKVYKPEMKKYLGCIAGRVGFVKDNGEFNKELLRQILKTTNNQGKAEEIIQACAIKKSSKEETGFNLLKCMFAEKGTKFYY